MSEYAQREFSDSDWENYYFKHVNAMTAEGLHAKSAIAAELAHRDAAIDRYRAALEQIKALPSVRLDEATDIAAKALE